MFIYGLFDPRNNELRYIGKTNQKLNERLNGHIYDAKHYIIKTHKVNWINSLLSINLKPCIEILEDVPENEWIFWEQWYIAYFKGMGCSLVNSSEGGENPPAGSHRGHLHSNESKEKMRQSSLGKIISQERRDKISKSLTGIKRSKETKLKMSEYQKSREHKPLSQEHKNKLSDILKGRKHSAESINKMSISKLGKKNSPQHIINNSKARMKINHLQAEEIRRSFIDGASAKTLSENI